VLVVITYSNHVIGRGASACPAPALIVDTAGLGEENPHFRHSTFTIKDDVVKFTHIFESHVKDGTVNGGAVYRVNKVHGIIAEAPDVLFHTQSPAGKFLPHLTVHVLNTGLLIEFSPFACKIAFGGKVKEEPFFVDGAAGTVDTAYILIFCSIIIVESVKGKLGAAGGGKSKNIQGGIVFFHNLIEVFVDHFQIGFTASVEVFPDRVLCRGLRFTDRYGNFLKRFVGGSAMIVHCRHIVFVIFFQMFLKGSKIEL
jgi:hypothetical protein